MLKRNSDITETKPKLDDTADKQSTKTQLMFCIRCRGDNTGSHKSQNSMANNNV